ncbi:hypothetical protein VM1G_09709 [Cytospora mali]|uniref:Uncharacterized protein n=1 Tax=Cytospora mali TaxID=578113 RepID=A0A194WD56_CYTMA|nr:hypothetical protein VM1G_09709 [Valsa mali]
MLSHGHRGLLLASLLGTASVSTQSFVPVPKDVTVIQSTKYPGSSISYKETHVCDTTPGVNSYSGHITVPVIGDSYNASIFFWYFEARNNSGEAPTTIYMPGGPGESFLDGASGFPCIVNPDSNSTTLNEWSWNANVNMLYVDMPVQTGYSYTSILNGAFDTISKEFIPLNSTNQTVEATQETFIATMSDQSQSRTANTSIQVAQQMWQISQVWFQEFPEWSTINKEINLWSYSYSGFFGPATVAYFQKQNELIANGSSTNDNDVALKLGTLGINNGCIDSESQLSYWPTYALNNTYGIKTIPDEAYEIAASNVTTCYDIIHECRAAAAMYDPAGTGSVDEVNEACLEAVNLCFGVVQGIYTESSNRSAFDIALPLPGTFPPAYNLAYYNQRWVQEALGVPVNFTLSANSVVENFFSATGDCMIVDKGYLEEVLNAGIGVAIVAGTAIAQPYLPSYGLVLGLFFL